jgi:hypothetical protein
VQIRITSMPIAFAVPSCDLGKSFVSRILRRRA